MGLTQTSEGGVKISNAGTNGQFLQKQSGNTGGLTWADVPAGVGGSNGADFNDNVKVRFGTGNDFELYHDGSWNYIIANNGNIAIQAKTNENSIVCIPDGKTSLYYDNSQKLETHNTGVAWSGDLTTVDGGVIKLGTGGDLQLYHDGSHSYIDDTGAGNLKIKSNKTAIQSTTGEDCIVANENGVVELYYDNSKKFNTYSGGVEVTGLRLLDSNKIKIGNAGDLEIYHDGTDDVIHSTGTSLRTRSNIFRANNAANSAVMFRATAGGNFEAFYDGSKKFETYADGIKVNSSSAPATIVGDGGDLRLSSGASNGDIQFQINGTTVVTIQDTSKLEVNDNFETVWGNGSDLRIYHNGTYNFIKTSNSNGLTMNQPVLYINNQADSERMIRCVENAAVELYHNGTLRAQTDSWGFQIPNGNYLDLPHDSAKIRMGASNDLEIFHDGTHSYVKDAGTGALRLQGSQWHVTNADASKYMVWAAPDAAGTNDGVYLYYNGTWRTRTTNTGLGVNGNLELTGSTGVDFSNNQGSQASGASTSSEILDHYEEGSWTPTNGSRTGTGTFVRIGALVNCWGYINNISNSGGSAITITGLPYTNTGNGHVTGGILSDHNSEAGQNLVTYVGNNESQFYIYKCDSGNWSSVTHNDLNSSGNNMYFNLTYRHA